MHDNTTLMDLVSSLLGSTYLNNEQNDRITWIIYGGVGSFQDPSLRSSTIARRWGSRDRGGYLCDRCSHNRSCGRHDGDVLRSLPVTQTVSGTAVRMVRKGVGDLTSKGGLYRPNQ
jgi:hypothetical protein